MSPEQRKNDEIWKANKAENRVNNIALASGWDGSSFRRGIAARRLFRHITNSQPKPKMV